MFEAILQLIKDYDTIIIHRHSNPDGDALGSQIGMKELISRNFPEKTVNIVGDMSQRFSFMEGAKMDEVPDGRYRDALAIILDTSVSTMISDSRYKTAKATARIDHHLFCETIAEQEVIDSSFESCAGMVAAFAKECGLSLTPLAAKSLYTGMVTDSGRFRYDSVNARTFALASFLMEQTFSTADIYASLYADDFSFIQLRAKYVLKINLTGRGAAYIYTQKDELKEYGVEPFSISRGMVNTMGEIKGVSCWVNFTEVESDGNFEIWCEIRSSKYNINQVAVKYGGGGHMKASGATLHSYGEAMALLEDLNLVCEGRFEA